MSINSSESALSGYRKRPLQSIQEAKANPRQGSRHLSIEEEEKVSRSAILFRENAFRTLINSRIDTLTFRNQGLKQLTLPPDIGGHNSKLLKKLDLRDNQLTTLPRKIGTLKSLTHLFLRTNQLTSLPETIRNLTQLKSLSLDDNNLTSLPREIGNLEQLAELSLDDNNLISLPGTIRNLTQLKSLSLNNNGLLILPETIGNLGELTHLTVNNNELRNLPETIGNLRELTHLAVNNNELISLPETFRNLTQLISLSLDDNNLISLPGTIRNLKNLRNLLLKHNPLISLPDEIGILTQLRVLEPESNRSRAQTFPSSSILTATLTQPQRGKIFNDNQQTNCPKEIGILTPLRFPELESNRSRANPTPSSSIFTAKLRQLQRGKIFSNNQQTNCPKEIRILTPLRAPVLESKRSHAKPSGSPSIFSVALLQAHQNKANVRAQNPVQDQGQSQARGP